MMKSVVTNPYFNWSNEYRGHTPLEDTVIYELHVKGFTKRHPAIPPNCGAPMRASPTRPRSSTSSPSASPRSS